MPGIIYSLVKFVDTMEFAEEFQRGMLHMNSLRTYKEYRDINGELRGDRYEGLAAWYQPNKCEITVGGHKISSNDITCPIAIDSDHLLQRYAFCLYALHSSKYHEITLETLPFFRESLTIPNRCFDLGKFCVVITKPQEFIDRVVKAIKKNDLSGKLGLVEYFDEETFSGVFEKDKFGFNKRRSLYSHQKEYRVLIDFNKTDNLPVKFSIGNCTDISSIIPSENINKEFSISLPADN